MKTTQPIAYKWKARERRAGTRLLLSGYNTKVFLGKAAFWIVWKIIASISMPSRVYVTRRSAEDQNVSQDDFGKIHQYLNYLIVAGICHKINASDIHIEPREDYVQVRYRITTVFEGS